MLSSVAEAAKQLTLGRFSSQFSSAQPAVQLQLHATSARSGKKIYISDISFQSQLVGGNVCKEYFFYKRKNPLLVILCASEKISKFLYHFLHIFFISLLVFLFLHLIPLSLDTDLDCAPFRNEKLYQNLGLNHLIFIVKVFM